MRAFKDDYSAKLSDAVKLQRRFQRTLLYDSYQVAICGSTITKGKGKDVDVVIVNAAGAVISSEQVAEKLMRHSKRLTMWLVEEFESHSVVYLNFVTHDDFYVDVHIKGL